MMIMVMRLKSSSIRGLSTSDIAIIPYNYHQLVHMVTSLHIIYQIINSYQIIVILIHRVRQRDHHFVLNNRGCDGVDVDGPHGLF